MKNEFVKWRKHNIGGSDVDFLEMVDGVLLQWYSGFDAGLCSRQDDPKSCTCDNVEVPGYENWYNNTQDPDMAG